jgi:hypothetical protein
MKELDNCSNSCISFHLITHLNKEAKWKGGSNMSQKRDKGYSQKGKPTSDTVNPMIAEEELEKAIYPTNKPPRNAN